MGRGLLLVNLGTPKSYAPGDVKRYLNEFLTDPNVIELPSPFRQLLVKGIIVPRRYKESARTYQKIWTDEGSPLLAYGLQLRDQVQNLLPEWQVELAMRYQEPSIRSTLQQMQSCDELIVLPLFPQYAHATTGSIVRMVNRFRPDAKIIKSYHTDPHYISALSAVARKHHIADYDQVLLSFHGLPLKATDCALYRTQCFQTAHALATELNLTDYKITFQSRLGRSPWLEPYTSEVKLKENSAVLCPSFVADCLETLYEIKVEYGLNLIPCMNAEPEWAEAVAKMARAVQEEQDCR